MLLRRYSVLYLFLSFSFSAIRISSFFSSSVRFVMV